MSDHTRWEGCHECAVAKIELLEAEIEGYHSAFEDQHREIVMLEAACKALSGSRFELIKSRGCPGCGGPTEYSRDAPPHPYYCDNCDKEEQ